MVAFLILLLALFQTTHAYVFRPFDYNFVDISSTGSALVAYGETVGVVTLEGAPFPFYGADRTQFAVSAAYGYLDVNVAGDGGAGLNMYCALRPALMSGTRVYVFYASLTTTVYYQHVSTPTPSPSGAAVAMDVIQWKGNYDGSPTRLVEFQVQLFANGDIAFQFKQDAYSGGASITGVASSTVPDAATVFCRLSGSIPPQSAGMKHTQSCFLCN